MKTLNLTTRLIAAAAAATTTLALFAAVVSIGAPDQRMLVAKTQHLDRAAVPTIALALASTTASGRTAR